jgi:hypothetical protein
VGAVPWKRGALAAPFAQAHAARSLLRSPIRCPLLHRRFLSASAVLVRSAVTPISPIQRSRLPARPGTKDLRHLFSLILAAPARSCPSDAITAVAHAQSNSLQLQRARESPCCALTPPARRLPCHRCSALLSAAVSDVVAVARPGPAPRHCLPPAPPECDVIADRSKPHQSPFAPAPLVLVSRP